MDLRRGQPPSTTHRKPPSSTNHQSPSPIPKASDALPLPLYLTNLISFTLFFSIAYFLLHRWRDKIRSSTPLQVVTITELAAIVTLLASFIYLLGFFGIDFVQSFIATSHHHHDHDHNTFIHQNDVVHAKPKIIKPTLILENILENDEEIIKSVISGTIPSYSLESKLGDCFRATLIRRKAIEKKTGKSLVGLPVEGFDYESILGQCCEMPIGYVQLPVGIGGPLLLNGGEYMVPMATTEGCLVASVNRGCKAIFVSGGATAVLLKDGMTRAPVVRFETAARAASLKFFLEDPINFDTLSIVFNK